MHVYLLLGSFHPWLLMISMVGVLIGVPFDVDNGRLLGGIHIDLQNAFQVLIGFIVGEVCVGASWMVS
jgi:cytochrome bd-type quinol oxidase subunit 2